ncbi:DUF4123 domain-containing protein [Kosakonia sp. YIM B13611]|uniref:DUF4123 domain-containing protein n=1 Tax=unclassified Kosakonia TaxID=2632876 RepID=UPI0036ABEB5D
MDMSFALAGQELIASTRNSLFALVDGLQFERHFNFALQTTNNAVLPLFDKYPDSRIAFAGPWLIDMHKAMALRGKLTELEQHLPAVSWILSALSLPELLVHLQQCMNAEMPDGRIALVRLQDPRVQIQLGEQLDEMQHREITKNIAEWYSSVHRRVYSLKQKEFIC